MQDFKFELQRLCHLKQFDIIFKRKDEVEELDAGMKAAKATVDGNIQAECFEVYEYLVNGVQEFGDNFLNGVVIETDRHIQSQTACIVKRIGVQSF